MRFTDMEETGSPVEPQPGAVLGSSAVDNLRRRLKYFFMNPCEKYKARGHRPWKLVLQILKIVVITIQLVFFGLSNQMMVSFKEENLMSFRHLFLKVHKDRHADTYSVYTKTEVYNQIFFIVNQYNNLRKLSVDNRAYSRNGGNYTPLSICQESYKNCSVYPGKDCFDMGASVSKECIDIYPLQSTADLKWTRNLLNFTLDFERLLSVNINFKLKAINVQTVHHNELPDCYDFTIMIVFDNRARSGKIKVTLYNDVEITECKNWNIKGGSARKLYCILLLDFIIIVVCVTSVILCSRSVVSGINLLFEYSAFLRACHNKGVSWSDRMEFVNSWYILIIISDGLTITGSVLKIEIQTKNITSYDVCSILLGSATLLTWVGVIRYLGFFQKYNILILTMRAALLNVVRFCCCSAMIYVGYCFCGWIVLGPHHAKFRTLNCVAVSLFSLFNGDDLFHTFKNAKSEGFLVWLFSRLYLYSFVIVFTFLVLNLCIGLITDTYETIKELQRHILPESQLQAFIEECKDHPTSGKNRVDEKLAECFSCSSSRRV